jgi:hypothetical protein
MRENDFSNVTRVRHRLIRPPNNTHPPVTGDSVSHGRNGHLQKSTRLPRDSLMIAPSIIRYPLQLSAPTYASDSDSLPSGSEDEASCWPDHRAYASVNRTTPSGGGPGALLLF